MTGDTYYLSKMEDCEKIKVGGIYKYHRIIYTKYSAQSFSDKKEVGVYIIEVEQVDVQEKRIIARILMVYENEDFANNHKDLLKKVGQITSIHFNYSFNSFLIEI